MNQRINESINQLIHTHNIQVRLFRPVQPSCRACSPLWLCRPEHTDSALDASWNTYDHVYTTSGEDGGGFVVRSYLGGGGCIAYFIYLYIDLWICGWVSSCHPSITPIYIYVRISTSSWWAAALELECEEREKRKRKRKKNWRFKLIDIELEICIHTQLPTESGRGGEGWNGLTGNRE